ncbi:Uncharacterised protein g3718 [Pycnogonum litorale]
MNLFVALLMWLSLQDVRVSGKKLLKCYTCSQVFGHTKRYERHLPCFNATTSKIVSVCSPESNCCQTDVTEKNSVITALQRQCSISCFNGCIIRGFGVTNEICTRSCYKNKCNNGYPNRKWFVEFKSSANHIRKFNILMYIRTTFVILIILQ